MSSPSPPVVTVGGLDQVAETLDSAGVVLLRNYLPNSLLEAVQVRLWDLVDHVYRRFGAGAYASSERSDVAVLDGMLLELFGKNPRYESFVYDTSRHLPEVAALLDCPEIVAAVRAALRIGSDRPIAINNRNVRVDLPGEDWNENLPWHQDYPYKNPLYSPGRSLATWLPVFPCPVALGPAVFKIGSHRAGEVSTMPHSQGENRTLAWTIPEQHLGETAYPDWQDDVEVGDLIVFSLTTIHKSGVNRAPSRVRWTLQARYHDITSAAFTDRYDFSPRKPAAA